MFGWELPPQNSGGLGVACYGLAKKLAEKNTEIIFVLPRKTKSNSFFRIIPANIFYKKKIEVDSILSPYLTTESYRSVLSSEEHNLYGKGLFEEVKRYAKCGRKIALNEKFDVIHAHDWLSFGAGLVAKEATGKPLVVHVHATEFDRGGGNINQEVYRLEKEGMEKADKVVAVSNYTKKIITDHYGIPAEKIEVVHNGIDFSEKKNLPKKIHKLKERGKKIVLFVGRLTIQKGPDYFVKAAKRVCNFSGDFYFVISGSGDMEEQLMKEVARLGISDKVIFTGFLRGEELKKVYQEADLFVMPSVSEPFGLTPLESIINGTPVLLSKQSGVSEVLSHALKIDFWDVDDLAGKILSFLNYEPLSSCLIKHGREEVEKITWDAAANKCLSIYEKL